MHCSDSVHQCIGEDFGTVQAIWLWDVYTTFPPLFVCVNHTIQWIDLIGAALQLRHAPLQVKCDPKIPTPEQEGVLSDAKSWILHLSPFILSITRCFQTRSGPESELIPTTSLGD